MIAFFGERRKQGCTNKQKWKNTWHARVALFVAFHVHAASGKRRALIGNTGGKTGGNTGGKTASKTMVNTLKAVFFATLPSSSPHVLPFPCFCPLFFPFPSVFSFPHHFPLFYPGSKTAIMRENLTKGICGTDDFVFGS